MNTPILNIDQLEFIPRPPELAPKGELAERYDARMAWLGTRIGAQQLGYNVTAVPPGKRAFPLHSHRANEEMFFVLQGSGTVRIGSETHPVRAGDVIACPAGGPDTAHQIINTGSEELRYLAVSTKISPEVCEFPESGKFGVTAELAPSAGGDARTLQFIGREGDSLNYWEGN